jgi:hypothetical protein
VPTDSGKGVGGDEIDKIKECCNECSDVKKIDKIVASYKEMVKSARSKGYNVAADNLEHWLIGGGTEKQIPVAWLRSFSVVKKAEKENQERFEDSLKKMAYKLGDKQRKIFSDYWDKLIEASVFDELYYASGTSTLHSSGKFKLAREGDGVSISGTVNHEWYDPYDWHAGLGAYIPGFGRIPDSDALLLEKCRGAKEFMMKSSWQQIVSGLVEIKSLWGADSMWPDSVEFKWIDK